MHTALADVGLRPDRVPRRPAMALESVQPAHSGYRTVVQPPPASLVAFEGGFMTAHVAFRPDMFDGHPDTGCFVVCPQHDLRISFGASHAVALSACKEHNARHHPETARREHQLLSVVYRSVQTSVMTEGDLAALLLKARHANRAIGVTGMLLMQDGSFLQALEGPEPIVRNLLAAITRDPRHRELTVLVEEFVQARHFPDWAMAEGHIAQIEARPLTECYEAMLIARGADAV